MRIAFVLERLGNGGAERVTSALANELSKNQEFEIHVFTCVKEVKEYKLSNNVKRHNMESNHKGRIITLVNKCNYLRKDIQKIQPDVVISLATPKTTILLSMLHFFRKFFFIVSERNDPNQYPKAAILKKLRNFAYRVSDGVVFQTFDAKKYFSEKIQIKSTVIPNPISADLPKRWTEDRRKVIVNFCRLEPQKNIEMLLNAFANVSNDLNEYQLYIYGEGPSKSHLEAVCKKLNLEEKVKFMNFSTQIHLDIIDASLFVSSSNYEGMSNSMLEAIAIGVPTICTNCPIGGARMIIKQNVNGILVPVGDVDQLALEIKRVLLDTNLSHQLSINGVKLRDDLSISLVSQKWLSFIESRGKNE